MKLERIFLRTYRPTGHEKNETFFIRRRRISRMGEKPVSLDATDPMKNVQIFPQKVFVCLDKRARGKTPENAIYACRVNFMTSEENDQFVRKQFDL